MVLKQYQMVCDYRKNEMLVDSFNELVKLTFGMDFSNWYKRGCWSDNYICYPFADGGHIIANASINKMVLTMGDKKVDIVQIGTVMTHPDYKNQGLAAKLLNYIIEKYEKENSFLYLFANNSVLDFYPRFGFQKITESRYSLEAAMLTKANKEQETWRKLNMDHEADFVLVKQFAQQRVPVSTSFGIAENGDLLMFYALVVFPEAIYYDSANDIIIFFEQDGEKLHIFDIVSKQQIDAVQAISSIVPAEIESIQFYFVPDSNHLHIRSELITETDDTLFMRPVTDMDKASFVFPITSHI